MWGPSRFEGESIVSRIECEQKGAGARPDRSEVWRAQIRPGAANCRKHSQHLTIISGGNKPYFAEARAITRTRVAP